MTLDGARAATLPIGFQSMTMARGLRAAMTRAPDKIAIRHNTVMRTYRELVDRIDKATNATINELKLIKGDHAAIVARNSIEYVEIVCGVPEAGVAVATVNPRLTAGEIVAICDDAQAKVVFCDNAVAESLRRSTFKTVQRIIEIGDEYEAWLRKGAAPAARPLVDEWDVWTIPYTSGTTGKPKGVLISHRSRILTFMGMALEYGCYGPDDTFLGTTPMNHGAGICFPMAALFGGGSMEFMDKFDAEALLRRLKSGGFSGVFMVPTQFHQLFGLDQKILDECRGAAIKTIISNAAPLPQAMKQKIVAYFGEGKLHETYGSTEGGVVTNLRPPDQLRKQQCVGTPFLNTLVKIVDDNDVECPPGIPGELLSLSPYLFNGYWNRPKETAETFKDGWVSVGDIAKRDTEGFIYIVDRKKDMVISGGVNIYPREIEEVLFGHPAIADVAIVGLPDEKWGERLKAFVVLRAGHSLDGEALAKFCEGKLASYKVPKDIGIVSALPRNANGKVLKTELRGAG
ncbi:MAG: class I adenylate-forming enzyme family protein [Rhodospirillaceae bacterium]|nr:class I adenylate-forming enzyme family protein [Rhodospirillaceae bacterium]